MLCFCSSTKIRALARLWARART